MTGYVAPAALPAHVMARADVRAAIASHDFGTVFTLARKWGGISFLKIADACGIKPERVGTLARGEGSITTYGKICQIADGLRIPGRLLGLAPRDWENSQPAPAAVSLSTGYAKILVDDLEGEEVRRRQFVAASLAITGAASLPESTSGRRVGDGLVCQLRQRTARLRCLDDYLGGADTFQTYVSELNTTTRILKESTYTESTGRGLLSVVAEQAQQAGWAAFDAGDQAEAQRLYKTALTAAQDAEDAPLAGNSLAFLAYQQVSSARPGVEIAAASCETAGQDAPPTVRALLFERRAWAHAKAGETHATEHALAMAEAALNSGSNGDAEPDWSSWVDRRELKIMAGRCWTELHRPLRAVPVLEEALAQFDDNHARDKALYLSWLANAYLDAGEIEQSAEVIGRAMTLAQGVGSVRPQQRTTALLERIRPHHALQPVAELLERAAS